MSVLEAILELNKAYRQSFTNQIDKSWGTIFYNEEQSLYYDANHAEIKEKCQNPQAVINQVKSFYQKKEIIPRFYLYNIEEQEELLRQLIFYDFKIEEFIDPIQVWNGKVISSQSLAEIKIEPLSNENYDDILNVLCSIEELGGRDVREKALENEVKNPNFIYYLLRYQGVPCATACLFTTGHYAKLESVATLEAYRGRGLIGTLIRHIQAEVVKMDIEYFLIFPINEKVGQIYERYGFITIGTQKMIHAYLGEKGIKHIQGE